MTISKQEQKPFRTFYRRELPSICTAFSSLKGRIIFQSAMKSNGLRSFFTLIEQFTTQSEPAFCGISTLVMVLNALLVDPRRTWKGSWRWYTENMLNCCMDLEEVKKTGITLKTFACLSRCQGLGVDLQLAEDATLDDFREAIKQACVEDTAGNDVNNEEKRGPYLVVSYHRGVLDQTGTGHFSPIAAFDPKSDKVLILDTARFKYGPHWVDVPLLFEAMTREDPETGRSRGFVLLSFEPQKASPFMPVSMVARSRKKDSCREKEYMKFLQEHEFNVTWEQVYNFWTRGGKDPELIWQVMEPMLEPLEPDYQEQLKDVRREIWEILAKKLPQGSSWDIEELLEECQGNRTICLRPEEAIFIVYLASIPKDRRIEEVMRGGKPSTLPRQQLLVEAELVSHLSDPEDEKEEKTTD